MCAVQPRQRRKRGISAGAAAGLDLVSAMTPSLVLVAFILFIAWCEWWI